MRSALVQVNVENDGKKSLGALLHLRQFSLVQFLTDKMCDASLANDHWYTDENLFADAVPALRQRA